DAPHVDISIARVRLDQHEQRLLLPDGPLALRPLAGPPRAPATAAADLPGPREAAHRLRGRALRRADGAARAGSAPPHGRGRRRDALLRPRGGRDPGGGLRGSRDARAPELPPPGGGRERRALAADLPRPVACRRARAAPDRADLRRAPPARPRRRAEPRPPALLRGRGEGAAARGARRRPRVLAAC